MDDVINFITESNSRAIFFSISFFLTLCVWYYIWRTTTNVLLKLLYSVFAAIPFIGSLLVLWIFHMPDSQPIDKRATMNHYGEGGKFLGFGDKQYTHSDFVNGSNNDKKTHKK